MVNISPDQIKFRAIMPEIEKYLSSPEAIVITGMRRTGKTTILNYFYYRIDTENKLYLDLENPVNRMYFEESNYEKIKTTFEALGLDLSRKSYVFLDEIQLSKSLPSVVKYFIDHYGIKFLLTGSASYYLKNLFTESLSGRKIIFELFPLTFREFLRFKDSSLKVPGNSGDVTRSIFDTFAPLYDEYIAYGGFPGVVLKSGAEEKRRVLEEIFISFFQMEIVQLADFRKNDIIRDLILLLMQRIGSKLDIQKLSQELGVSRTTLNEYIAFLESTYFIKRVRPFTKGRDCEIRKAPKIYLCDTGLANRFAKLDAGALFENCVLQNLMTKGEVNYYRKKSGVEVDFIFNKTVAYEVKITPDKSDANKLAHLSREIGIDDFKIVSGNFSNLENVLYGFMI
jgi:predicted AAA+ superfamily ATPase